MDESPPTEKVTWRCGCVTWTRGQVFLIEMCSAGESCPVVQIALHESHRMGNLVERVKYDDNS